MPYLIDGHNLIGQMPDIDLADPEDEMKLLRKLEAYFKKKRISGIVYFDQRGPGMKNKFSLGRLKVEFITHPGTADNAIRKQLQQTGKEASNYIVISSDRQVAETAHAVGARTVSSHEFSGQLGLSRDHPDELEKPQIPMTSEDIRIWQDMFKSDRGDG